MSKTKSLLWLNLVASGCAVLAGFQEHSEIRVEDGTTYRTTSRPNLPLSVMGGVSVWGTLQLMKTANDDYDDDEFGDDDEQDESPRRSRVVEFDDDDDFDFAPPIIADSPTIVVSQRPVATPPIVEDSPPISLPPEPIKPPSLADRYGSTLASMIDMRVPKHLAILATTRMGKTFFLKALMAGVLEQTPDAEIWIIDPKGTQWPPCAHHVARPGNYNNFDPNVVLEFWQAVQDEAEKRQNQPSKHPLIVVGDEWATTFSQVVTADKVQKTEIAIQLEQIIKNLVLMSLEGGIHLVLITQTTTCKDIGMTDDLRANLQWYALARADNAIMITDKLLGSRSKIFDDTQRKNRLKGKFEKLWYSPKRQYNIPIVVDAQRESVEYVPDFTNVVNAIDNALPTIP